MTVPTGDYATEATDTEDIDFPYVNVRVVEDVTEFHGEAAAFGSWNTVNLPASGVPVSILNRRPKRHRALIVAGILTGGQSIPVAGTNGAFAAAAGGSATLPAGSSLTGFDVNIAAATAAGATTVTVSNVLGANYVYTIQQETTQGAVLSIRYPGNGLPAASSGAVPTVTVNATAGGGAGTISIYGNSVNSAQSIVIGTMAQVLQGLGYQLLTTGQSVESKNQQGLYAAAIGGTALSLSVLDEAWQ